MPGIINEVHFTECLDDAVKQLRAVRFRESLDMQCCCGDCLRLLRKIIDIENFSDKLGAARSPAWYFRIGPIALMRSAAVAGRDVSSDTLSVSL